jgi:hypothetical protein
MLSQKERTRDKKIIIIKGQRLPAMVEKEKVKKIMDNNVEKQEEKKKRRQAFSQNSSKKPRNFRWSKTCAKPKEKKKNTNKRNSRDVDLYRRKENRRGIN